MRRPPVDLSSHLNQTIERGHPADFPVALRPVFHAPNGLYEPIANRRAVVREDTGEPLAIVSDRYALLPHQRILDTVHDAIEPLDVGPVPRGVYVDRQGARMRALYKFPTLARPVGQGDDICPCLQIRNTYDGTARIGIHIGAFRFVCTNLAVGGGGIFAGGFVSIHAGDIPIEQMAQQLANYLKDFEEIVTLYQAWADRRPEAGSLRSIFDNALKQRPERLWEALNKANPQTVYAAYNVATDYATHQTRSYRTAFDLLERINDGFQKTFPVSRN
jgi:hypothetical protein